MHLCEQQVVWCIEVYMLEANSLYWTTVPPNRLARNSLFSVFSRLCFMIAIYFPFQMLLYFKSFFAPAATFMLAAFIHIYDGTHSPDRNNLFFLFIIEIMFNCEIFQVISACYSDACTFPYSGLFIKGEFNLMFDMQIIYFISNTDKLHEFHESIICHVSSC